MPRTGAACVVVTLLAVCSVAAQQPTPKFEVASVRAHRLPQPGVGISLNLRSDGSVAATRASLAELMLLAYGLADWQLAGGPSWIHSDRFDIVARPEKAQTRDEGRLMLQSLLEERFSLVTHREARERTVYSL